jgi:hypothetical protein
MDLRSFAPNDTAIHSVCRAIGIPPQMPVIHHVGDCFPVISKADSVRSFLRQLDYVGKKDGNMNVRFEGFMQGIDGRF